MKETVLLINNYHYRRGGSDAVYLETGKLLESKGHPVMYLSACDGSEPVSSVRSPRAIQVPVKRWSEANGIRKIGAAWSFIYSCKSVRHLDQLIEIHRPDVAHLHIFYGRLTSSILPVLKRHRVPSVMTVHDYRMLCPIYVMRDRQGRVCSRCAGGNYIPAILKRCNRGSVIQSAVAAAECLIRDQIFSYQKYIRRFIMVSRFCRDVHNEHRPALTNAATHLYNFVNMDEYAPRLGHDGYMVYFGRLSAEKGLLTLLRAWESMSTGSRLKIVGDGPLREALQVYCHERDVRGVEFCGHKGGDELRELVANASFTVVPSEWLENNPMSAIESLALGTPVIGAHIGGIPELIDHGTTGMLFPAGDETALLEVLKESANMEPDRYHAMAAAARRVAETLFGSDVHYAKLISVYKHAIREQWAESKQLDPAR